MKISSTKNHEYTQIQSNVYFLFDSGQIFEVISDVFSSTFFLSNSAQSSPISGTQ